MNSPFDGITEKQGNRKLLKVDRFNPQMLELEEEQKVNLMEKAKNKGYYNKLYDQI